MLTLTLGILTSLPLVYRTPYPRRLYIPWQGGQNTMGLGEVKIPWIRGSKYHR
jgi:hypothetical protein